jgi:hypothetical protein
MLRTSIWEESLLKILLNHYPNSVQLQEIYKEMMPQFPDRDHEKNFQREIRGYLTRFGKKGIEGLLRLWHFRRKNEHPCPLSFSSSHGVLPS